MRPHSNILTGEGGRAPRATRLQAFELDRAIVRKTREFDPAVPCERQRQLLKAEEIGRFEGERDGFRQGFAWGAICGGLAGAMVVGLSVLAMLAQGV